MHFKQKQAVVLFLSAGVLFVAGAGHIASAGQNKTGKK
jgi:hypothetical protein